MLCVCSQGEITNGCPYIVKPVELYYLSKFFTFNSSLGFVDVHMVYMCVAGFLIICMLVWLGVHVCMCMVHANERVKYIGK